MYQDTFPVEGKLKHLALDWSGLRVTEIGCNIGGLGDYALSRGAASYTGSDLIPAYIEEGRRRFPHLDLHVAAAPDAPLDGDLLVALGVFHHMSDEGVREVFMRTPAQGILFEQPMRATAFQNYFMRSRDWYRRLALSVGFTEITEFPYGFTYPIERGILLAQRPASAT